MARCLLTSNGGDFSSQQKCWFSRWSLVFFWKPSRQTVRPGLVYHLHTLLPEKVFEAMFGWGG